MKPTVKLLLLAGTTVLWSAAALAKLPALSDEAKAKAAEAAAKTAWAGKVDGYLLCKAQDRAAAHAAKTAKAAGKEVKPAAALPPCLAAALQVWSVIRGKGKKVPSGGTLVVGREQDCEGGCFDSQTGE